MNYLPVNGLRLLAVECGLLVAAFLVLFLLFRYLRAFPAWLRFFDKITVSNRRTVLFVVAVALVGRALLLPVVGIPQPRINDEFSYLLLADTFSHHRLTNPTPPAWPHFETFHVNLVPTYHSKYPVAQGLALAFGQIVFAQPWVGVYFSTALLCGAICWALQAFVPPGWALVGALLATVRLAFLSYWMNSYWGGSMAALGGALALGAVVRLFAAQQSHRRRMVLACVFAVALLLLATSRPYEGLAFALPLLVYFGYQLWRTKFPPSRPEQAKRLVTSRAEGVGHPAGTAPLSATVLPAVAIGLVGLFLIGYYNRATTGNFLLFPYVLNERTYSSLPLFLGQRVIPQGARDPVFAKYYAVEAQEHRYEDTKSVSTLAGWELRRLGVNWFFYVGPALTLPVFIGFLSALRQRRLWIVLGATLTTAAAVAMCVFTQPHYFSPATIATYVFAAEGLRYLWQEGAQGERAFVAAVCLTVVVTALGRQTGSTAMNSTFTFPDNRALIARELNATPGKHLVLVSYDMERHYPGDELVHNWADFPSQRILWARSKGEKQDRDLCDFYGERIFWSVYTDDYRITLRRVDLCR